MALPPMARPRALEADGLRPGPRPRRGPRPSLVRTEQLLSLRVDNRRSLGDRQAMRALVVGDNSYGSRITNDLLACREVKRNQLITFNGPRSMPRRPRATAGLLTGSRPAGCGSTSPGRPPFCTAIDRHRLPFFRGVGS